MKRYRVITLITGLALASALSACQKNPDESIVKNKDFDKMIDRAKDESNGVADVNKVIQESETYKNTISEESLGVTVNVDANVDVPKADKLSILRVKQKKIPQEFLDNMIEKCMNGEQLYDAAAIEQRTRKDVEQEMQFAKENIEDVRKQVKAGTMSEEILETYEEEFKKTMDRLKETKGGI